MYSSVQNAQSNHLEIWGLRTPKSRHCWCVTEDCAFNNTTTLFQIPLMYK